MQKRNVHKNILKNVELFRARQRGAEGSSGENFRKQQYRELQEILSPFWAWRTKSS